MALALTTQADLNNLFNEIFEDAWFVARETNIMTGLATPYNATGWMARKFSSRPQLVAKVKPEGEQFTDYQKFDKKLAGTLTPEMIMAGTLLTDQNIETDPENAKRDAATELGNGISSKIDTDLGGDFALFTTDKGPGADQPATIAKFAVCIAVLRNAKTPNPIYIVLHPYHWLDIWTELGQPAAQKALLGDLANQALRDFFVGDWLNARWFVNANLGVDANDDAVSGVFNPQALAFDSRRPPTPENERDIDRQAWKYVISGGYAHGVRRKEFGIKYTADAAEPE